jgi:acetoin utilization deacetylase AcuC-like enzyme
MRPHLILVNVTRLWYSDQFAIPLPPGHKFPVRKYRLLRETLTADGRFTFDPAPFAATANLELAHDSAYIRAFLNGTLDQKILRRVGFPWSENLVRRSLASVGGTVAAARDALAHRWGGNLAGGTHHAFRAEGSGFCVFNDMAVAICTLRAEGLIARAAVVDLDVHQGDGTAKIFEHDPDVLTVSVHGSNNFPFRKQESRIDVGLPDGTQDDAYLAALQSVLPRVFAFRADIVFYQSGVDALASDKLGRLNLTHAGLEQRDRMVFSACRKHGTPCAITLGGGYSDPIEPTVQAHAATFRIAADELDGTTAQSTSGC